VYSQLSDGDEFSVGAQDTTTIAAQQIIMRESFLEKVYLLGECCNGTLIKILD
jgi:hypothetical protein